MPQLLLKKEDNENPPVIVSLELDEDGDVNVLLNGTKVMYFGNDGRTYLYQGLKDAHGFELIDGELAVN